MKIKVAQEFIDNAKRKDSHHCMIADALAATVPGAKYVFVDVQTIRWTDPATRQRFICLTPPKAQVNIINWDQGEAVAPFEINIQPLVTKPMGWRALHPGSKPRKHQQFKPSGRKNPVAHVKVEREFGIRKFS